MMMMLTRTVGLLLLMNNLAGIVEGQGFSEVPPRHSYENLPITSFSCEGKLPGRYYADPEADCQLFHVCVKMSRTDIQDFKFLCPNGTVFDQEHQVCNNYYQVVCFPNIGINPLGQVFELMKLNSGHRNLEFSDLDYGKLPITDPEVLDKNVLSGQEDFQVSEYNNNRLPSRQNSFRFTSGENVGVRRKRPEDIFFSYKPTRATTTRRPRTTTSTTTTTTPTPVYKPTFRSYNSDYEANFGSSVEQDRLINTPPPVKRRRPQRFRSTTPPTTTLSTTTEAPPSPFSTEGTQYFFSSTFRAQELAERTRFTQQAPRFTHDVFTQTVEDSTEQSLTTKTAQFHRAKKITNSVKKPIFPTKPPLVFRTTLGADKPKARKVDSVSIRDIAPYSFGLITPKSEKNTEKYNAIKKTTENTPEPTKSSFRFTDDFFNSKKPQIKSSTPKTAFSKSLRTMQPKQFELFTKYSTEKPTTNKFTIFFGSNTNKANYYQQTLATASSLTTSTEATPAAEVKGEIEDEIAESSTKATRRTLRRRKLGRRRKSKVKKIGGRTELLKRIHPQAKYVKRLRKTRVSTTTEKKIFSEFDNDDDEEIFKAMETIFPGNQNENSADSKDTKIGSNNSRNLQDRTKIQIKPHHEDEIKKIPTTTRRTPSNRTRVVKRKRVRKLQRAQQKYIKETDNITTSSEPTTLVTTTEAAKRNTKLNRRLKLRARIFGKSKTTAPPAVTTTNEPELITASDEQIERLRGKNGNTTPRPILAINRKNNKKFVIKLTNKGSAVSISSPTTVSTDVSVEDITKSPDYDYAYFDSDDLDEVLRHRLDPNFGSKGKS